MLNPIANPLAFDRIEIDDVVIPVQAIRTTGGDREVDVQQQQGPGYAGYFTLVKNELPSALTYQFVCISDKDFTNIDPWIAKFEAAIDKRPVKVFKFKDNAVAHNKIKSVGVKKISALLKLGPGKFAYEVDFYAYKKRVKIGGVAVPGKTETDKLLEAQEASNKALEAQLQAMKDAQAKATSSEPSPFSGIEVPGL